MRLVATLSPRHAAGMLAGLVQSDLLQIHDSGDTSMPVLRGLKNGSIRYEKRDPQEHWRTWAQVVADGYGDCEDLVPATVAELESVGIKARPVAYETEPGMWHVVTQVFGVPGVDYIDPSREGGMGDLLA